MKLTRMAALMFAFAFTIVGCEKNDAAAGDAAAAPAAAAAAQLVQVTSFGNNPTSLSMYLYVPNNVATTPGLLLALHYCTGTGPAFYQGTEFASLADQYGFIVIYPSATRSGQCWDVSSSAALERNGGSDPVGLMSMISYVQQNYNIDASRIFVTGASSGAMMTNVMLGDYPDVFTAGAAFMGVPFGCFATTDGSSWNSACANGQVSKTPQAWGDLVRAAYPGYSGARPRMQLWHGTADTTLYYANFGEEIKQWTNVLGVSQTASFTDYPQSSWTRTRYGGTGVGAPVEAISLQGVGHSLPQSGQALMAIQFFGLDGSNTGNDTQSPTAPTSLGASNVTSSSVTLSWTGSTDNVGVTGYAIFQQQGAGAATQVGTSTSTTFNATGLSASTTYVFYVKATDAAGNTSANSNSVTVTTTESGGDTQSPTAPGNLTASGVTSSGVTLTWSASTDNVGVAGYRILSGTTQLATTTTTSYVVTGLSASTPYTFSVTAFDAAANVSSPSSVNVTTSAGSDTGAPCDNAITFINNTSNFNTTGAVCYRTSATINGWDCANTAGRTLTVNNTPMTCGQMPLPAKWSDGYTYFAFTAGNYPWASMWYW